jgi:hypothetical protein
MTRNPQNKILLYTLRNLSLAANVRESQNKSATRADTTMTWRGTATYNLTIPQENIRVRLLPNYFWHFSPRAFNNNATIRGETGRRWDWAPLEEEWRWRVNQPKETRNLDTSNEIVYDILTDLNASWRLTTRRDLMNEQLFQNVNIGTELERQQDVRSSYNPVYMRNFAPTQFTVSANYRDSRRIPNVNYPDIYEFNGSVNRTIGVNTTLQNSKWITSWANRLGESAGIGRRHEANLRESGTGFGEIGADRGDSIFDDAYDPFEVQGHRFDEGRDFETGRDRRPRPNDRDRDRERIRDEETDEERELEREREPTDIVDAESRPRINPSELIANALGLIGRIQNLNMTYNNTYGTNYSQRDTRPE